MMLISMLQFRKLDLKNKHISRKEFHVGQKILLYDSRLHLLSGKLKARWTGSYVVAPNGSCDIMNPTDGEIFKVNGQMLKHRIR